MLPKYVSAARTCPPYSALANASAVAGSIRIGVPLGHQRSVPDQQKRAHPQGVIITDGDIQWMGKR